MTVWGVMKSQIPTCSRHSCGMSLQGLPVNGLRFYSPNIFSVVVPLEQVDESALATTMC